MSSIKGIGEVSSLQNDSVLAVFDSFGAKCLAIIVEGENLLFYEEDDIGHSGIPLCFPSFGPLANNEFNYDGQTYPMKQHGFIRDNESKLVAETENSLTYQINETEDTLNRFPFKFTFKVTYTLLEKGVKISTSFENNSDSSMPLSPGIHPYFAVDNPNGVFFTTNADSAFNNLNSYQEESIEESNYLEVVDSESPKTVKVLSNPDHHMPNHNLETLEIIRDGQKSIKLTTDPYSFKLMTVWRKSENSKFVCLEPANIQDGLNKSVISLKPGQCLNSTVSIFI